MKKKPVENKLDKKEKRMPNELKNGKYVLLLSIIFTILVLKYMTDKPI